MNRDELAALGRALVSVIAGAALLGALGHFLGWWTVGVILGIALGDAIRCAIILRWWP